MGIFVFLPLILPLSALPIARPAEQHLHPRAATRLMTTVSVIMAFCSTVCLGLLGVVGTAQIPGNPLPDNWSDPEVRAAVPFHEEVGTVELVVLAAVVLSFATTAFCRPPDSPALSTLSFAHSNRPWTTPPNAGPTSRQPKRSATAGSRPARWPGAIRAPTAPGYACWCSSFASIAR